MKETTILKYIKILSFFGILLSVYLLWQRYFHPSIHPCSINSTINCDAIINGPVANTLGIPTPLYGLTGYIIIFISSFLIKKKTILGMALFGLIFCLWIAYQELFLLRVICPVCILCQVTMIGVFILSIMLLKKKTQKVREII